MPETKNRFAIYKDEELMLLIAQGEVLAFDEIYNRYGQRLLMYFTRMLNFEKAIAEDALQDLFLKIAESPEKFDRSRSFKTWIFSVASNCCKNHYRHQSIVKQSKAELLYMQDQTNDTAFLNSTCRLDFLEFKKMLDFVLNELPPEKKEVFILKYQEEKSLSEIAEIQNCAIGSVKSRLHYTLKILEEKLKLFNPVNH